MKGDDISVRWKKKTKSRKEKDICTAKRDKKKCAFQPVVLDLQPPHQEFRYDQRSSRTLKKRIDQKHSETKFLPCII
jgi:hypothetical protein